MAAKFLYIRTAADDAVTLPVESLQSISQSAGDTVVLEFLTDKVNGNIAVSLTTASNKEKEAVEDISNAIAFGKDQFLVIADDVSSDYVSSNLSAVGSIGRDVGPRRKVEDVTGTSVAITAADSGKIYTLNNASNATVTLTLPVITAGSVGSFYEFNVGTESTGAYLIKTGSVDNTSGDTFVGACAYLHSDADQTANQVAHSVTDASQIALDSNLDNSGGDLGTSIKCVATSFSDAGHSIWTVSGNIFTHDADGDGTAIFTNI